MSEDRPLLVALCGSLRRGSYNRLLLRQAVATAEAQGARVDVVEWGELDIPPYNGDAEDAEGLPPGVQTLKARIADARALLVASPEYNHSIPGVFKNAIDWATRGGNPFAGKVVALMGASTGGFGAVRSLQHLRQVFMARGAWVAPGLVTVSQAASAFDADGTFKDEALRKQVESLVAAVLAGPGVRA